MSSSPGQDDERDQGPVTRSGLAVTNLMKLTAAAIVVNEVFLEPQIRNVAIAAAALLMTGGQALESFLMSFFGGRR